MNKTSTRSADRVAETLQSYADRGVFRGFVRRPSSRGTEEFRFRWLHEATFRLRVDPVRKTLVFQDLLPNIPYRSVMDRALRDFFSQRTSEDLPEHRRIDPGRVELLCSSRRGSVSVSLRVVRDDWEYAVKKGVSLVHEVFHGFLKGPYYEYMVENFGEPEE